MAENKLHILLVEDDKSHAEMIRRSFAAYSRPVQLTVVETVKQAKEHLHNSSSDLVIADLILPDGKGTALLPSDKESLAYPVIIMTSFGNEQAAVEAIKAGALDYVVKSDAILKDIPRIVEHTLRDWDHLIQRKHVEEALRESEEKFRYLAEQSPNMIFIHCRGGVVYANKRCEELIGYTRKEFYSPDFDFMTLIAPGSQEIVRQNFRRHLANEDVLPYEYVLLTRVGTQIDAIMNSKLIKYEGDNAILGIVTDISELKQAEKALKESEALLKSIFENTAIGIYRTTPDGKILTANPVLVRMLGYSSFEELAQRDLEEEGFDANYPRSVFKEKIERKGRIAALESAWKRKDGSIFYARENAIAIRDKNGNICYYEGTVENITEQKQAEQKILEYQKQLRSLASQLSLTEEQERRKLATALHDNIGQLLAISKIKQGALADKSPPETRETLNEIRKLTEQAIHYTRTLTFELSPPILYELGLPAAVEWLVEQIRQQHNIDVRFESDNSNPPLENDIRVLLFQAVRELLVNVAKHSQANRVNVSLRRENHKIRIAVEDNGIGMEPTQITTIGQTATGFGLFNIRERLDLLGGKMNIQSQAEKGTKITLLAPLKNE
jgi:PAS domain S-box-containing protein